MFYYFIALEYRNFFFPSLVGWRWSAASACATSGPCYISSVKRNIYIYIDHACVCILIMQYIKCCKSFHTAFIPLVTYFESLFLVPQIFNSCNSVKSTEYRYLKKKKIYTLVYCKNLYNKERLQYVVIWHVIDWSYCKVFVCK